MRSLNYLQNKNKKNWGETTIGGENFSLRLPTHSSGKF